jgi:hypothetical protein
MSKDAFKTDLSTSWAAANPAKAWPRPLKSADEKSPDTEVKQGDQETQEPPPRAA